MTLAPRSCWRHATQLGHPSLKGNTDGYRLEHNDSGSTGDRGNVPEIFSIVVVVGGLAAMALGIARSVYATDSKRGIRSAIGAVVGGIILSLIIPLASPDSSGQRSGGCSNAASSYPSTGNDPSNVWSWAPRCSASSSSPH